MNLIAKLFILSTLVSIPNILSCNLYDNLADNAEQVTDILDNNKSFNTLGSSNESRSRRPRSTNNAYMKQNIDKNHLVVADMQNDNSSSSLPQQVNSESSKANEDSNIMKEIESSTEECARLRKDLETIKQILDNIESLLNTANSYLENARKAPKSNQDNQTLLLSLHQAIAKVKSSHTSFIICYNDAFNSLGIADTAFKDAKRKAVEA
ncbi:hypothetical protein [Borreliella burgdorferi]|uniref:Bbk46-like n=2 Tax=Borreliella burgdorferi TaxID=139 RepID=Q6VEX2_BORBG|nr:hypothetical protein [Borreliella burgdorferi]AAQ93328.1 bbk46-like [Borreliella burgdorferi]AAQ93335.1 bbk46-like [Borreliella burgdorferi]AAQ93339.1 bbk46-like [Borreliella burgdorferi]AAQ93344.1 bbk46-like [Borreliella burgdorferi]AAQ93349.1 bbk46-like [Borreliella burgdorferi]